MDNYEDVIISCLELPEQGYGHLYSREDYFDGILRLYDLNCFMLTFYATIQILPTLVPFTDPGGISSGSVVLGLVDLFVIFKFGMVTLLELVELELVEFAVV